MNVQWRKKGKWSIMYGLLLGGLLLIGKVASAGTIGTSTLVYGTATDGGASHGWTIDGAFDSIDTKKDPILGTTTLYVTKTYGSDSTQQAERRAAFEFQLPAVLTQPGVTITNAVLYLNNVQYGNTTLATDADIRVFGYPADGQLTLQDFANTSNLAWSVSHTTPPFSADVTSYLQSVIGTTSWVGFVVSTGSWGTSYELDPNATLQVEYTSPANLPPTVVISAPANNSQVAYGSTVTFQGSATDPEGMGVGQISWTSNLDGLIGAGSTASTNALSIGTHTITATATDSAGLAGQASITITVGTTYCDARGTNANYEWINSLKVGSWTNPSGKNGGYGNFLNSAAVPMVIGSNTVSFVPGFASGSYTENWRVWIDLNGDSTFGTGEMLFSAASSAAINSILTIPTGTRTGVTRMRVAMSYGSGASPCGTFSYGEVEDYLVNIVAAAPPPPASYCASKGSNAAYEWIDSVDVAGVLRSTGKNGGYGDMTAMAPIALVRGSNNVNLRPGFASSAYYEYWHVWVDLDQNKTFSDNELLYSGSSQGAINYVSINVPATATAGSTRMRISMKYGNYQTSCETFSYGEVEDYTVTVP